MTTTDSTHTVERDGFTVTFHFAGGDVETVDDARAVLTLPDDTRWSATFMTVEAIARTMHERQVTGERLGGRYFQAGDLVIVHAAGIPAMVEVIQRHVDDDNDERVEWTFQPVLDG